MTITEQFRGKVVVLGLKGNLMGEPEASLFQEKKFQLLEANRTKIVLDLSQMTIINSAGLGSLIAALVSTRTKGGDMLLAGASKSIDYVIQKVQLGKVFKIFETVEEAVSSFEHHE